MGNEAPWKATAWVRSLASVLQFFPLQEVVLSITQLGLEESMRMSQSQKPAGVTGCRL